MPNAASPIGSPPDWSTSEFATPARRIRRTLFWAMSLATAGIIAVATVSPIIGAELGGSPAWAGTPTAMVLVGSSVAAPLWGIASDRLGRRASLGLGMAIGAAGVAIAGVAYLGFSLVGFLVGMTLIGTVAAASQLSRFAAAEVHPPALRARAISTVVLGGAVGSVVGPLIVGPSAVAVAQAGLDDLAGPFAASVLIFVAGAVLALSALRPEPMSLGRAVAAAYQPETTAALPSRPVVEILRGRAAGLAVTAMVVGQMVMLMVMVMTSLHMRDHDHPLGSISLVIASHTFGMYAFSVFSGRLADRYGRIRVIVVGAAMLTLSCLAAPLSPQVLPLAVSLFFLGLGWNFCYVGGSSLLADQLLPSERGRTQGINDMLVGAASAASSLGSGIVFAAVGYAAMAFLGAAVALIPLGMALSVRRAVPATAS